MSPSKLFRPQSVVIAAFMLLVASTAALAETQHRTVTAPDGVTLAVQESGNPNGFPIIFIHGLLGSRLNWSEQLQDPRFQQYRLITYDLRGHGLSDKPAGADAYSDGRRWADDLAALIESMHAHQPVLVGWSLGAAVITNYLSQYGDSGIAGAVYVGGVIELQPDQIASHPNVYRDMISPDLKTHLDGERAFLQLCFHRQPEATTFSLLLANAALASWEMQRAVPSMTIDATGGLGKADVPLLLIYGARDALVNAEPSIARAMRINPRIQSKVYAESGHAPFLEEVDRFNRDLLDFLRSTASGEQLKRGGVDATF